jgi:hypothetical protein
LKQIRRNSITSNDTKVEAGLWFGWFGSTPRERG